MMKYSFAQCFLVASGCCMLPTLTLKAQFKALPDSTAIWNFRMYDTWQGLFDWRRTYLLPGGVPDTTINGQDYQSLSWYWDTGTWLEEFGGGLRESGSGQVFYYHPNTEQEHLLYDFDVSVGDSVLGVWVAGTDPANGFTTTMYVTGVDTIILGGQARKRIGIQNIGVMGGPTGYWWIQGIGGSAGLLETAGEPILDVVYGLECMSSNDTVWWSWGPVGAPGACSPNGVPEHVAFPVVVGPNPGTGRYTLYGSTLPAQMIVLDPQGREVLRTRTHNIDLSAHPPGLYTVVVTTDQGRQAVRLVHDPH
ncbi:MAG: T9SS type A sorting domain-containing protein [Flavobacteriales bacterium]|nr:T9SS type A sorting domain-containing protein [Flavobacteriales bacterium]